MKLQIAVIIILLIGGYIYITAALGDIDPVGRLGFVKLSNPDMYPDHPHSEILAKYAEDRGSESVLVVHFAGSSNYRHYMDGDVLILQLGFIDQKGATTEIDWSEVITYGLFGIPEDRWKYKADGKVFDNLDDALNYLFEIAKEHGQEGPIPMFYHGTARGGSPIINQGCGFPLYYHIARTEYGMIPALYYVLKGMIYPYLNLPYRNYELQHAAELQYYYTHNMLNYE